MAEYQGFLAAFFWCALILGQRSMEVGGMGGGEGWRWWQEDSGNRKTLLK